ncbi:hypothetical protein C8J56DRAFT_1029980 [Mycena floridula]|nr:hypothetical protein C8J56DRAFT_1032971 [Mycena floridula]KAJ7580586.1 hypothetical protein C8J56DRAFT_1029980 [Mycena floridula]
MSSGGPGGQERRRASIHHGESGHGLAWTGFLDIWTERREDQADQQIIMMRAERGKDYSGSSSRKPRNNLHPTSEYRLQFPSNTNQAMSRSLRDSIDDLNKCHLCGHVGHKDSSAKAPKTVHSARLQNLLLCNEIPLQSELAQFQDLIATEQAGIVDLDRQILKMRHTLKSLFEKRVQKQRNIVDYKKVVDPLRRLPEDLLREIFLPLAQAEPQSSTSLNTSV